MPFIDDAMGHELTEKTIDIFDNVEDPRQMEYMAVLIVDDRCKYDPEKIARYAIKQGHAHRLGYLTELAIESAKNLKIGNIERAEKLKSFLENHVPPYFDKGNPDSYLIKERDEDKKWAEKMMRWDSKIVDNRNERWHVYSRPRGLDIGEVQRLYLVDIRSDKTGIISYGPHGDVRIRM